MLIGSPSSFVGQGYVGSDDLVSGSGSATGAATAIATAILLLAGSAIGAAAGAASPTERIAGLAGGAATATATPTLQAAATATGAATATATATQGTFGAGTATGAATAVTSAQLLVSGQATGVASAIANPTERIAGLASGAATASATARLLAGGSATGAATASATVGAVIPVVSLALFVDSTGGPRYRVRSSGSPSYQVDSTGGSRYRVVRGHEITSVLEVTSNVIPYNSLSTHPLAEVVIDPSQFPDTAAFQAWFETNFLAYNGGPGSIGTSIIDPSKLFNGHATIKVLSPSGFVGYRNLIAPVDKLCMRMAIWIPDTYVATPGATMDDLEFPEIIDDHDEYSFAPVLKYGGFAPLIESFDDGVGGGPKNYPLSAFTGRWVFLIMDADHAVPAAARNAYFVDALKLSDETFDSGSGVAGINTIDASAVININDGSPVTDPDKYLYVGVMEFVPGAAQDLYSGLDTTITSLNPDPVIPASRTFPAEVLVQPSATYQFILLIDEVETAADSWATNATGGSISAGGLLTAGATSGEFTVTATKDAVDYVAQCEVAAFNPKTDVAGLYRWCEVEDMALADADPITPTLDDSSGGGHDLVNAFPIIGAPIYKANAQNGYAASETDGMADVHLSGEVPFGAHTTFTACKILPGGDHEDYCVPMQRWAEGAFSTILRFITGSSLNNRWQVTDTTPGASVNLGGDSLNWSLVTDRLVSDTVQEVSLNDGAAATMTPVAGMFDGPAAVQDRVHAHTTSDVSKMHLLLDAHWSAAMSDTEARKSRRWINGRYRLY